MEKTIVPTLCVLVGCAAGAALTPAVTAQWPDNPAAQRWQQTCEELPTREGPVNELMRRRGEQGWELVDIYVANQGYATLRACFKRPAP